MPEISSCDPVVEENSLVKFGDKLVPVVVKGVDSTYAEHVNIFPSIVSGIYSLEKTINQPSSWAMALRLL